jgi:hypothetical protein
MMPARSAASKRVISSVVPNKCRIFWRDVWNWDIMSIFEHFGGTIPAPQRL